MTLLMKYRNLSTLNFVLPQEKRHSVLIQALTEICHQMKASLNILRPSSFTLAQQQNALEKKIPWPSSICCKSSANE